MQGKADAASLPTHVADLDRKAMEANVPSKRVYRVWQGSNVRPLSQLLIALVCLCGLFPFDCKSVLASIWLNVLSILSIDFEGCASTLEIFGMLLEKGECQRLVIMVE